MTTIKERTQLPARWQVSDADGVAAIPTSIRWRIDCRTTSTEALDWQSINPDSLVDFTIPAAANVIVNDRNRCEVKRLSIEANAGLDSQISDYRDYTVTNNRFTT